MPTLAEPARLPQPPGSAVTDDLPMLPQPEEETSPPQISRPSPTPVVEGTPPQPLDRPEEPKLIHGPVVEAAPEFVFPPDVPPSPPRNVIPAPGAFPPRNTIPAQ